MTVIMKRGNTLKPWNLIIPTILLLICIGYSEVFGQSDYANNHQAEFGPGAFGRYMQHGVIANDFARFNIAASTPNNTAPALFMPRITTDLQVLYNFREGSGSTVNDVSGVGTAMNLTIANAANVQWQAGQGLKTINTGTNINGAGNATKIIDAVKLSDEISLEVWIQVDDADANGPARIITVSADGGLRGATLGQNAFESPATGNYFLTARVNTSDPGVTPNGTPDFSTNETYLAAEIHHVVYTRNAAGVEQIYVDGVSVETGTRGGDFSSWANNYVMAIASENATSSRNWLGTCFLAAVYSKALTSTEVLQNFNAGYLESVPADPTALVASPVSANEIGLTWQDNADNETGYEIHRSLTTGSGFALVTTTASNITAYTDNSLSAGTPYFYKVRAVNGTGTSNFSAEATATTQSTPRVSDALQVLYDFKEGSGSVVNDVSGIGAAMNLTIANTANVQWQAGQGLKTINTGTTISNAANATKIIDAVKLSNEISMETWIQVDDADANGPARILTISVDGGLRGATLGQNAFQSPATGSYFLTVRLNTSGTGVTPNGDPDFSTNETYLPAELHHVVYTRNATGTEQIYVDGVSVETGTRGGDFSTWANNYKLAIANENVTGNRSWLGTCYLAAVYSKALSTAEVLQNFNAGYSSAPPADPTVLVATATSSSEIGLTWQDNSADETGFEIHRSLNASTGFSLISTQAANVVSFNDTGLTPSTPYYYKVRAVKGDLNSAFTTTATATTNDLPTIPTPPTNLTAGTLSSAEISLSWQDNADNETGYEIHRSLTAGTGFALVTTTVANLTTFTDTGLTAGTIYYYKVRGVNATGTSNFGNEVTATTQFVLRVSDGLQVLYNFREGTGNIVHDVSGTGAAIDLTVDNIANVQWQAGQGLKTINTGTIISNAANATKIIDAVKLSNEISMEAWIQVDNADANGPARILTISVDGGLRGATLGQNAFQSPATGSYFLTVRLNTSGTGVTPNGDPDFSTNETYLAAQLHHVIYTRNAAGTEQIYVDGVSVETGTRGGDFSTWANNYKLAIANEISSTTRHWFGTYYLAAVYSKALTSAEVLQNFNAGFVEPPPADPTALVVSPVSSSEVSLTWQDNSSDETGFEIHRSLDATTGFSLISTQAADVVSFNDMSLTHSTTYYYKVRAVKGDLNSGFTATASVTTNDLPPLPVAPSNVTAGAASSTEIMLTWQDNSDNETGYEIHRSLTAATGFALVNTTTANITTFTDSGLASGTKYYYKVRAVNITGTSDFSVELTAKTQFILRVSDGLQVLYNFKEGSGNIVHDVSNSGTAMDLTIANATNAQWQVGQGLKTINTGTIIEAAGNATKIIDAVKLSNEISMEAWLQVDNADANGPARIITISVDGGLRGATLGQNAFQSPATGSYFLTTRLNTSDPGVTPNGTPDFSTNETYLAAELHHVVYTRSAAGEEQIYVDGVSVETGTRGGDFSTWANNYKLAIAGENQTTSRNWFGTCFLAAVYSKALTSAEVLQNFNAGYEVAGAIGNVTFTLNTKKIPSLYSYNIDGFGLGGTFNSGVSQVFDLLLTAADPQSVMINITDNANADPYAIKFDVDNGGLISNFNVVDGIQTVPLIGSYFTLGASNEIILNPARDVVITDPGVDVALYNGLMLTPNGDGSFDQFVVNGLETVTTYMITISDLQNTTVFQSTDKSIPWNGTDATATVVPKGTYMYEISADGVMIKGQFIVDYN